MALKTLVPLHQTTVMSLCNRSVFSETDWLVSRFCTVDTDTSFSVKLWASAAAAGAKCSVKPSTKVQGSHLLNIRKRVNGFTKVRTVPLSLVLLRAGFYELYLCVLYFSADQHDTSLLTPLY